jgi:hypothetical protein
MQDNNKNPQTTIPSVMSDDDKGKQRRAADPLHGGVPATTAADVTEPGGDNESIIELTDEIGGTGTYLFDGFLTNNDPNPDWSGFQRTRIADEMRLTDATIRLGLDATKHPIIGANWYIKPGEGEEDDSPMTSLVREELFENPNFFFRQFIYSCLLMCDYGNMGHEKIFRKRADGKIGWARFAPRLPHTFLRYMMPDGFTPGITQILPTGSEGTQIPQWKMLLHILDLEGSNYEGRSLLRPAYQHYFYKKLYYRIDAIASQRQGMGFPVIHLPPQASPADKAKAREIAKNIRVNERAYADLPEGFTLEFIDPKGHLIKDVEKMIQHHDREELVAFKAQFLNLGATTSGSQNASQDQRDLFYSAENYTARTFQEPTQIAVRELIDLNFSNVAPAQYPSLQFGGIGTVDFMKWSKALLDLAQGGYVLPTDDDERHIRQVMTLPPGTRFSDEQEVDPETRKIPIPQLDPQNPNDVSLKKPTRYVNSSSRGDQLRFKEALEDVEELHLRIQDALDKKKPVQLG